jgi:hypothetical protein
MSAAAALIVAGVLAGCGSTTYFDGRVLPPSGLANRVLIAIQNPSAFTKGALQIVDAYYDIRYSYNDKTGSFSIAGYSGALPVTIQNMPEEQFGAVYGSGDGSLSFINYQKESSQGGGSGLSGPSSSVFVTRNQQYVFAASQAAHVLTVIDKSPINPGTFYLSLPGVYRVSVNPGGTAALAFVQNSNSIYYPLKLTAAQTISYSGGTATWPLGAVDCEPLNSPGWCLFQALDPTNNKPLALDRPVKAIFSSDGGTAYVLNCGPECGGGTSGNTADTSGAGVSLLPVAPMIFLAGQTSGALPTQNALNAGKISTPGGSSNALLAGSTFYVVGQQLMADGYFGGHLTLVNLATNTAGAAIPISDGQPGAVSRLILADDNTLWIGMTQCTNGERYNNPSKFTGATGGYGCLTMFNTSTNTPTLLESYLGDLTGIAAVTGLHKIYVAQGGQVYIYSTVDGSSMDNQYVTVNGTAYDVAYMDAITDGDNTVY